MLSLLHIENVAVIERADVEFGPGLNVLTGETGAGKSIIIDSIGAILGARASRELIRTGSDAAIVSAELTASPLAERWLEDNAIEYTAGDNIILYRKISADGKGSCRINGMPVSVAQLRELGDMLFDLHGQNDGRRLLSEANHRRYLDDCGGLDPVRGEYENAYALYIAAKERLRTLKDSQRNKEIREQALRREIELISSVNPVQGEEEELAARRNLLRSAGRLSDKLGDAYTAMYGDDDCDGALSLIMDAQSAVEAAARIAEEISVLAENMGDFRYRAEDIGEQIRSFLDSLDFSPGELDRIETRLSDLERLSRRYGDAKSAQERLVHAQNELEDILYITDSIEKTERETERLRSDVLEKAQKLTAARIAAARQLEQRVIDELKELNMPGIRFETEFAPKPGEGFDSSGAEEIRFLISANAGEEPGRLSRIASGGELSRIMLAIKNVLSADGDAEVLIFDEVDTGVSGIAAQRVGQKLSKLAVQRQVLCITHLAQIAAMADVHFSIVKTEANGRTFTIVTPLDTEGRKSEIARLTGGETVTETTLLSAGELIKAADNYKKGSRA